MSASTFENKQEEVVSGRTFEQKLEDAAINRSDCEQPLGMVMFDSNTHEMVGDVPNNVKAVHVICIATGKNIEQTEKLLAKMESSSPDRKKIFDQLGKLKSDYARAREKRSQLLSEAYPDVKQFQEGKDIVFDNWKVGFKKRYSFMTKS